MMRWMVQQSLKLRFLLVAAAAVMVLAGIMQLRNAPVDIVPEFSRPYVQIQTEALGLSAAEVEALITVPLEADMLNGVAWVDEIRSESIPGLSSITLVFQSGTNILDARQMVQERLIEVFTLPGVSKPPFMLQPLSSANRVMMIGLSSKDRSLIDMSVLARWTIRPRLMGVPGVANVAIWGQRERQLQVQVDPKRLKEKGVTLNQVIKTTGNALWVSPLSFLNASTPGTGGFIDTPNQRLGIQHISPIRTAKELAQVTVDEAAIPLGDVATVVEDHQPLIGDAAVNDGPGLMLVIEKFPGADTLAVTRDLEAAIDALRPGLSGIQFDTTVFRPATFVQMAIANFSTALVISSILVVFALGLLFYDWRTALISLVAIALSVLAAALVLYLCGVTFNAMVLAGLVIALGAIIDDAIVDVENVARRLRQCRQEGFVKSTAAAILKASLEMRGVVIYAALLIALVVVPLFFMEGLFGALLGPIVLSYALALLTSTVVALTVTPALCRILLSRARNGNGHSPLAGWLRQAYTALLARTIRRPLPAFVALGAIALAALAVLPRFRQESLLPTFKETDLLIEWEGPADTSHPEMWRIATQASRELRAIPGVRNVGAHVGRAMMSDEVGNINSGELWVSINPAADYDATVAAIRDVVDGYPGLSRGVFTQLNEKFSETLSGTDQAIDVRIYGEDLDVLHKKADEVRDLLSKIGGIVDPQVDRPVEQPQVEIEVSLDAAKKHGLKPGDVRRAAATLLSGIEVGNLFEEQKVFEVVVWGTPEIRHSLTGIRELLIDKPGGGHVRLDEVADVRIVPTPSAIQRDAVARYIDVGADVRGRSLASVAREVESRLKEVQFPLEFRAELLGQSAERQAARNRVLSLAVAAAIGIYLLLQAAFRSWSLATMAFLTLPLALAGGVLAAFAAGGGNLSFGVLLGLITVFGIAARQCILLVRHYQELEQQEGEIFGPELVLRGTGERFAPIVMTVVTLAAALLPMTLFGRVAGLEIVQPMALVILGGLATSTLLALFVLPALCLRLQVKQEPFALREPLVVHEPHVAEPQVAGSHDAESEVPSNKAR